MWEDSAELSYCRLSRAIQSSDRGNNQFPPPFSVKTAALRYADVSARGTPKASRRKGTEGSGTVVWWVKASIKSACQSKKAVLHLPMDITSSQFSKQQIEIGSELPGPCGCARGSCRADGGYIYVGPATRQEQRRLSRNRLEGTHEMAQHSQSTFIRTAVEEFFVFNTPAFTFSWI